MQSNTLLAPSESATQRNTLNMRDQMRPPPVDPSILRSLRQVESTPFEQAMIRFANITVFVFFAAVLFFTVLAKLPDRPPTKAAAPAKKAKSTGELRRDGKYTAAEVAKHDQPDDLWVIIKGNVYDVTSYVDEHPGGESILKNAGKDSTVGFHGPQHPSRVFQIIEDFLIGELIESDKDK